MKIFTNDFNNLKSPSQLSFNQYGDGDITYWLKKNNNYLCKFAYGRIKQGDTFIAYGDGAIWKVNGHVYAWMTSGTQQYVIIDITTNNYTFEIIGKYSIWDIN